MLMDLRYTCCARHATMVLANNLLKIKHVKRFIANLVCQYTMRENPPFLVAPLLNKLHSENKFGVVQTVNF